MAVEPLSGIIDAAVYETGYYPTGADVQLDILTNQNKTNEVVALSNTNEAGLAAEVATRTSADAALGVRVTANEEAIAPLLAGNLASATFDQSGDVALTTTQCNLYGYINLTDDAASATVTLPNGMAAAILAGVWAKHNIVITNMTEGTITVKPVTGGLWGNGESDTWGGGISLTKGLSVTVYPGDEQGTYSADKWYVVAGEAYPT